jgi:hypothetical protein
MFYNDTNTSLSVNEEINIIRATDFILKPKAHQRNDKPN